MLAPASDPERQKGDRGTGAGAGFDEDLEPGSHAGACRALRAPARRAARRRPSPWRRRPSWASPSNGHQFGWTLGVYRSVMRGRTLRAGCGRQGGGRLRTLPGRRSLQSATSLSCLDAVRRRPASLSDPARVRPGTMHPAALDAVTNGAVGTMGRFATEPDERQTTRPGCPYRPAPGRPAVLTENLRPGTPLPASPKAPPLSARAASLFAGRTRRGRWPAGGGRSWWSASGRPSPWRRARRVPLMARPPCLPPCRAALGTGIRRRPRAPRRSSRRLVGAPASSLPAARRDGPRLGVGIGSGHDRLLGRLSVSVVRLFNLAGRDPAAAAP